MRRRAVEEGTLKGGLPYLISTLAAWLAGLLADGRRPASAALATAGLVLLALVVAAPTPAWAHDPGQGRVRGHAAVAVGADGATAQMRVLDLAGGCLWRPGPGGAGRPARQAHWLPVQVDGRHTAGTVRELYSRPARPGALQTAKLAGGAVLYLVGMALPLAALGTARHRLPAGRAASAPRQPT